MNYKLTSILLTGAFLALSAPSVFAAGSNGAGESNCQIIYGGGEVCPPKIKFTIDKKVQSPLKGGSFVDNLSVNDAKYAPGNTVTYQVTLQNTGTDKITGLEVVDTLPEHLTDASGVGNYDQNKRTITWTVDNLDAGKSAVFVITAKVAGEDKLPQDKGVVCMTNTVKATEKGGATAQDSSELCVQKQILGAKPTPQVFNKVPAKEIPSTGPELFALAGLIPAGVTGFFLRKKSKLS